MPLNKNIHKAMIIGSDPIAKVAALIAIGYMLDEIPNFVTKKTKRKPCTYCTEIDFLCHKQREETFLRIIA